MNVMNFYFKQPHFPNRIPSSLHLYSCSMLRWGLFPENKSLMFGHDGSKMQADTPGT